jgi:hypothetical protein
VTDLHDNKVYRIGDTGTLSELPSFQQSY